MKDIEDNKVEDPIEEDVQIERSSFFQSSTFKTILWAVGGLLVLLLVFKAGEIVESQKADYSYRFSQNYYQNFVRGPSGGMDLGGNAFMAGHGVFGSILSINSPNLVVQDSDGNTEKDILTSTSTIIKELNSNIPFSDLEINEQVIIIGSPDNSGQIEARLIRIIPTPTSLQSSSTGTQLQ